MPFYQYTYWVTLGLFVLCQTYSVAIFLENIIKKKQGSLAFEPTFVCFCIFLLMGSLNYCMGLRQAIIYFILFMGFNVILSASNDKMTQSYKIDG